MSRIPTRLRALAVTCLTAVTVLTASSAGATLATATTPSASPSSATIATAATATASVALSAAQAIAASATVTTLAAVPQLNSTTAALADRGASPVATPAAAAPKPAVVSAASVVVAFARGHLHAAYRHDASGPSSFDCSGLMWRVFQEAGLKTKVTSHSARAIYLAYRGRGLASRTNPQVGDLIVWGQGSHVGVYIGNGYAISALINGVRIHRVHAMFTPFTAYLHTHLAGTVKPAWELRLASHIRSLRHATRTVFLRASAATSAAKVGTLRSGARFVVLARRNDAAGRSWLEALTFNGRIGWLPATSTAR